MNASRLAKVAVSGLVLGVTLSGGHPVEPVAVSALADAEAVKAAAQASARAAVALEKRDAAGAVAAAEAAVGFEPRNAVYRYQLARAYMLAGRFASAGASFGDVLTLAPNDARAALNLALSEIAQGKRDAALATLNDYRDRLAPSDLGLALALAGNVDQAVSVMENAIRSGGSTVKLRQNLALAYAMQGEWTGARIMALQDLSPDAAGERLMEWMRFVRPATSFDQVASLLGVKPVIDPGQPTRLALDGTAGPASQVTVSVDTTRPGASDVLPDPVAVAETSAMLPPAPEAPRFEVSATPLARAKANDVPLAAAPQPPAPAVASAPEVAQAPIIRAPAMPIKQVVVPASMPASNTAAAASVPSTYQAVESGRFVVQLGAFRNAAVSRDAWSRLAPRFGLTAYEPANARATVRGASFVRLAVGGFATRSEATAVCTRIQASGGACFVRSRFGDSPAQWVQRGLPKPGTTRIAAR